MKRIIFLVVTCMLPLAMWSQQNLITDNHKHFNSINTIQLLDAVQPAATLLQLNLSIDRSKQVQLTTNLTNFKEPISHEEMENRFQKFYTPKPIWERGLQRSFWYQYPVLDHLPTLDLRVDQ
ncbi:MAG: hypothetical protein AAF798_20710 [Bacteroidota bacterium]